MRQPAHHRQRYRQRLAAITATLLSCGCTVGTMGAWVVEDADDDYGFSEEMLVSQADDDLDAAVIDGAVYRHGFALDQLARDENEGWMRAGQGSASLYSSTLNQYLHNQAFGVSLRSGEDGDQLILAFGATEDTFSDGEYEDNFPPTGSGLTCKREPKRLDCDSVVFVRPDADDLKPSDDYEPESEEEEEEEEEGDSGEEDDGTSPYGGRWKIDCMFSPAIYCDMPEVLEEDTRADCTTSVSGTSYPVSVRVHDVPNNMIGEIMVGFSGGSDSVDLDGVFIGSNLVESDDTGSQPEVREWFSGECQGSYGSVNLEGNGAMQWRPD
jgi:hypothetical protein